MKRMIAVLCLFLLLCGLCSGCAGEKSTYYVKIGDVELDAMPRRVVTMSHALTETVTALGFANRLVGVCDEASEIASALPTCGTLLLPDTEKILSLSPEVLFSPTHLPSAAETALNDAGCAIIVLPFADTLEGVYTNWQAVATVLGGKEWGGRIDEQLRYAGQVIFADIASVSAGESAAFLMLLPRSTATGGTWLDDVLTQSGLKNAADDGKNWVYPADGEYPEADIIFCGDDITLSDLQASVWQSTSAVKNNGVIFTDTAALEAQSPRVLFVLQSALREAFPDADWNELDITPEMEIPETKEKGFFEKLFG